MLVREKSDYDRQWIESLLRERWGSPVIVVHGEAIDAMDLPALVAEDHMGLATYRIRGDEAEIVSLDSVEPRRGIGTALVATLADRLTRWSILRLSVTTTNDNVSALRFYQRRGFRLVRLRLNAVNEARKIKPSIPLLSEGGIPIRDELDLCLDLCVSAKHGPTE